MSATKVKSRQRKLDWKELEKDVKQNSESKLSDRAKKFGVNQPAIFYALKRVNFPFTALFKLMNYIVITKTL